MSRNLFRYSEFLEIFVVFLLRILQLEIRIHASFLIYSKINKNFSSEDTKRIDFGEFHLQKQFSERSKKLDIF